MKIQIRILTSVALLLLPCIKAKCQLAPARPLQETITASTTIVVCRLTGFVADPSQDIPMKPAGTTPDGIPYYMGNLAFLVVDTLRAPGAYEFDVTQTIKGDITTPLSVRLPSVLSYSYGEYWKSRPQILVGGYFLLLLRRNGTTYIPTDSRLPLVPIPANTSIDKSSSVTLQIANLLLPSGTNTSLRLADSYLLRTLTGPQLVVKLAPFITDPNVYVKDNVLACLAANQQVAVIPRIVELSSAPEFRNHPSNAVPALQLFTVPDAVPYLNPLVFNGDYDVRVHTMYSLYKIADRTSLPFLILGLRDPDPIGNIPSGYYVALRRLVPDLGVYLPQSQSDFQSHFKAQVEQIDIWWSDELLGKHLKPGEHPAIPAVLPNTPALLNPLLFMPDTSTRRAVASKLARLGDKSSIPYLILALQDPDPQQNNGNVSYVAYKILHRLIPALGPAEANGAFAASPEAAKQPIYHWWQEELMGKHLPKQPAP